MPVLLKHVKSLIEIEKEVDDKEESFMRHEVYAVPIVHVSSIWEWN